MNNKWYKFFKYVLMGPPLLVWNRPKLIGKENIPPEGTPAMMVSNHQAVMDSFYFPLVCPRQLTHPAKKEYFTTPGFVGRMQKFFMTAVGQVPIDREAKDSADSLMGATKEVFARGDLFCIYPEGTRSPDGRIYKGKTGMARVAMETGIPCIPVAMINTQKANPIGTWIPRPVKVIVKIGEAVDPHAWARENGFEPDDPAVWRPFTDYFMQLLVDLSGYPYVDMYAADVKKSLDAGHGYPEGAEPDPAHNQ
ncbi:lysophospholipid acyltransferase family protein [Corynebacterium aquatimens]|uniref:1-acyl-sn-glycerol-3-phosphate acyltransferase n=1 Tax=Corynebacterium aquatimens TaxID=1190508 RepID=A0A931DX95_9CORY|nr:lysophospholipid acyltransferase family protein [Corynebacterium aquatimens]MBG6121982.1 1-acyl-sn-glycerol-3-phosphate acyltransferase [Corynebacterium aquatimens]WJY65479.1 2-acyl-glycerophospho-ethanolamine acyltransferase [Corynebacterium aquatimens]